MATATLTFKDSEDGNVDVSADFGEAIDQDSPAHGMAASLLNSVLSSANSYKTVEDTAPEVNVEPSRIILPGGHNGI